LPAARVPDVILFSVDETRQPSRAFLGRELEERLDGKM
jgi:hypothetical protein